MNADAATPGDLSPIDLQRLGIGLLSSETDVAEAAESLIQRRYRFAPAETAETLVALGGDGFMLQTLHRMLALTPISPFRPRRWSGAILPDDTAVCFTILEAKNRPVSAVADQIEVRDVARVEVRLDRERSLTLLFDPEHALDERIAMEQFAT